MTPWRTCSGASSPSWMRPSSPASPSSRVTAVCRRRCGASSNSSSTSTGKCGLYVGDQLIKLRHGSRIFFFFYYYCYYLLLFFFFFLGGGGGGTTKDLTRSEHVGLLIDFTFNLKSTFFSFFFVQKCLLRLHDTSCSSSRPLVCTILK